VAWHDMLDDTFSWHRVECVPNRGSFKVFEISWRLHPTCSRYPKPTVTP